MSEFLLAGLNATNVLGYLAALGTLRSATFEWQEDRVRMGWELTGGNWQPRLIVDVPLAQDELIEALHTRLISSENLDALHFAKDLTIDIGDYRTVLYREQLSCQSGTRHVADFLAALGAESVQSVRNGRPTGQIADTAFRTMSGAGHQHFLGTIRTFIHETRAEHLEKALLRSWCYDDPLENHSMRWDPMDDIRYALRWHKPSGDRERKARGSMWGANRLAIEALPLFPCMPVAGHLMTTGFTEMRGQPARLTYPVWTGLLDLPSVKSLVALKELQEHSPNRNALGVMGIAEVFRCERITEGKYRNFTPATPV